MTARYPSREIAHQELVLAGKLNPGPWIEHVKYVALACENIARQVPGMESEKAYVLGLLHDIGRRVGVVGERHMLEGYRYCQAQGWSEAAKICITHSFMIKDIKASIGKWDVSPQEYQFMQRYIDEVVYDDYDLLVQLCDNLGMPTGFCLLEKRFIEAALRYGLHDCSLPRIRVIFEIKQKFETLIGGSIYDLLPGVKENTFANW